MLPIKPFEPVSSERIPTSSDWIAQVKWDGVRVLTYYDGDQLKLFNRSLNERTSTYPELQELPSLIHAESFILDGEIIALNEDGTPSFHEVMRRDRLKNHNQISKGVDQIPIFYMIFDVIYWDNEWINESPLIERMDVLKQGIEVNETIRVVNVHKDAEQLFSVIKDKGMEGIVCKDLTSTYKLNGKNDRWKKIKNYQDLYAIVCGVTFKGNAVNSFLLCLYDENSELHYIGSAGTGRLKSNEIAQFSKDINDITVPTTSVHNLKLQQKNVSWISPVIIVKVTYLEWTKDKRLRQPVIETFIDANPKNCTFQQS